VWQRNMSTRQAYDVLRIRDAGGLLLSTVVGPARCGQSADTTSATSLNDSVRELRQQIRELQDAVTEIRSESQRYRTETAELRSRIWRQCRAASAEVRPPPRVRWAERLCSGRRPAPKKSKTDQDEHAALWKRNIPVAEREGR